MQLHIVHSGRGAISPHVQRVRELSSADTFQVLWHKLCRQLAGGTLSIVLTYRTQYQHSGGAQTHALSIVQLTVYPPDTKRPAPPSSRWVLTSDQACAPSTMSSSSQLLSLSFFGAIIAKVDRIIPKHGPLVGAWRFSKPAGPLKEVHQWTSPQNLFRIWT